MRKLNYVLLVFISTLLFACSENSTDEIMPQSYNISGVVEKGPFVRGSTISIQPLNEKM